MIKYHFTHSLKIRGEKTQYFLGSGLLANLDKLPVITGRTAGFALIADSRVYRLYGSAVSGSLEKTGRKILRSVIPSGENHKTLFQAYKTIGRLLSSGINRKFLVLSLGGGVTGDLAGFVSSVLFRGIPFIHLPTTLLAQIDSSIGGKTGVDFRTEKGKMFKNLIGTFTQPRAVVCDTDAIRSLPDYEIRNGLGEMVKYYIGWKVPKFSTILQLSGNPTDTDALSDAVYRSQKLKLSIIEKDPTDVSGIREKLNLGHTVAHGIESASEGRISHGQAVSIGIHAAALISRSMNLLGRNEFERIVSCLKRLNLPITAEKLNMGKIISAMKYDKKSGTFVLIKKIGQLQAGVRVEEDLVRKVLDRITA